MPFTVPRPLRSSLWVIKHAACRWAHDRRMVSYLPAALESQLALDAVDLVVDVGANTGQYVHDLRRLGYTGDVLSFEPNPKLARELAERAARDARWQVVQLALGQTADALTLHVTADTSCASLNAPTVHAQATISADLAVTERVSVEVRRLDEFLPTVVPNLAARSVHLKIDTQGTDLAVFRGAVGILPYVRSLQFEVGMLPMYEHHVCYTTALAEIDAAGFACTGVFPVTHVSGGEIVDADYLFRRRHH